MRITFMGTPAFALPTLDALIAAGHEIAAVYCQPPRRAGRGKALQASPVQARAEAAGLEVRSPLTLRDAEAQQAFDALGSDLAVVAAYGLILPEQVLRAPRYGCLNVHASLLPRWRGAAPIQRAILAGDETTGVSIMAMEKGLDTGPVFATRETDLDRKTAGTLTEELAAIGAALMVQVIATLPKARPEPQLEEGATYAAKLDKAEARLDFAEPAVAVERRIRAFNPWPGAFFEWQGERFKILGADVVGSNGTPGTVLDESLTIACGEGAVIPRLIQRAGREAMTVAELTRGLPIPVGAELGPKPRPRNGRDGAHFGAQQGARREQ